MSLINYIAEIFNIDELKDFGVFPELEYIKELGKTIGFSGLYVLFNIESYYDEIFAIRYRLGRISDDKEKKQQFLKDKDLQGILEYYGLDPEKLWYLALFIVDYIDDMYTSVTIRDEFHLFINEVEQMTDEGKLSLKIGKRKAVKIEHSETIKLMAQTLKTYIENDSTKTLRIFGVKSPRLDRPLDKANYNRLSDTYKAFFFDQLFSIFLNRKEKVNDTGKRSKKELIAKMAAFLGIVSNRQQLKNFVAEGTLNSYIKGVNKSKAVWHIIYCKMPNFFQGLRLLTFYPQKDSGSGYNFAPETKA